MTDKITIIHHVQNINKRSKSMKTKAMVLGGVFSLVLTSVVYAQPAGKVYNLKFSYHTPPKASAVTWVFSPWIKEIEKNSNGRVKITQYAGSSLVKAKDQYDATISGLCDLAFVDPNETPGRFPELEFDTLPFAFPSAEAGVQAYWDILQKYALSSVKNVKVLTAVTIAGMQYAGNKKVRDLEDFKGLRIRSAGRTETWIIQELGATPIEIATSDLSTSLERGLIDGGLFSWSAILSFGIKDVTKYLLHCDMYYRTWMIPINKRVWDSMPADLQKVFLEASDIKKFAAYCKKNEDETNILGAKISAMNRNAGKPSTPKLSNKEKAEWRKSLMPVWEKWAEEMEAKKKPGKAIIADIQVFVNKYEK